MIPSAKESLSDYVERLMGEPKKKAKPVRRYEDLRDARKKKRA